MPTTPSELLHNPLLSVYSQSTVNLLLLSVYCQSTSAVSLLSVYFCCQSTVNLLLLSVYLFCQSTVNLLLVYFLSVYYMSTGCLLSVYSQSTLSRLLLSAYCKSTVSLLSAYYMSNLSLLSVYSQSTSWALLQQQLCCYFRPLWHIYRLHHSVSGGVSELS